MRFIRRLVPRFVKSRVRSWLVDSQLQFFLESYKDARRYLMAADFHSSRRRRRKEHIEADIVRLYHQVEKGLAMPDFRPRFGASLIKDLVQRLEDWNVFPNHDPRFVENDRIRAAQAALHQYAKRHQSMGIDVSDMVPSAFWLTPPESVMQLAGIKPVESVSCAEREAFHRVVQSRVSVRDFEVGRIPEKALIERAVAVAMRSPSVCNRQTCRVYAYAGDRAQRVLSLQNGNRGFGHTIPMVLIPTSDMRYLTGTPERYQAWVDGGLFSMTLLLALHAEGLGAVALNWCVYSARDEQLRKMGAIPGYERIIMLIGCGHVAKNALAPVSARRPLDDILRWDQGVAETRFD